ncbi:class I SAM-dependent methyltransferase [Spongiibacter marinus]|jgi:predicted TPR repeat methyltransferase|uniref:class I SAM-dependent DNA methyltransferase n=1 Tax=Spongiibacter marinus TaxID=354246 RepID=UPI0019614946|nr:class I SAM-dependent methyltransferase [Spongiibacter marinus]MBM7423648.1 putative TPR repeat methyltransferase [Spongiibacter marinus]MEE2652551.1 class I SAM-dependent methyltransferase [Pseudomonadota bacterium]
MTPQELGATYDYIAPLYQRDMLHSDYGLSALRRAIRYCPIVGDALDVGCGVGGRMIDALQQAGFTPEGIDVSAGMLSLAQQAHPGLGFCRADICQWQSQRRFALILAWDSLFHLPLNEHEPVLRKLCRLLDDNGVLIYSFGDAEGSHIDQWHGRDFHYSSIGISENLRVLMSEGLTILHCERDQHPQSHVYVIAHKRQKDEGASAQRLL